MGYALSWNIFIIKGTGYTCFFFLFFFFFVVVVVFLCVCFSFCAFLQGLAQTQLLPAYLNVGKRLGQVYHARLRLIVVR